MGDVSADGFSIIRWSDWRTLLGHMRQLLADAASYRDDNAALRAENAALKVRVNELVAVVNEQQTALDEQNATISEFEAQKQEIRDDAATISAALEKASDAYVNSRELAKQHDALGVDAPGNGIKHAAIIDAIRALLALAEKAGASPQALIAPLSFCIKFAEMPDGKMNDFMSHFTNGRDSNIKEPGGRSQTVAEMALTARIAAAYDFLKDQGVPASEAKITLANACGLNERQYRKILDIATRVGGSKSKYVRRLYREAQKAVSAIASQRRLTPQNAATRYLKALLAQDQSLNAYIQK